MVDLIGELSVMEYNDNSIELIVSDLPSKPVLSNKELLMLYNYSNNIKTVLEFGTGGSSFLFSKMDKVVYSFDTDENYIRDLQNHDMMKSRLNIKHFFFHCDVGKVAEWGIPLKPTEYNFFSSVGKHLFGIDLSQIDLFFIDGRYRVESALSVLVNSKDNSRFIIHDFSNREHYHELFNYFDIIESVDTLVVLKKKTEINLINLQEALVKYQQDYR